MGLYSKFMSTSPKSLNPFAIAQRQFDEAETMLLRSLAINEKAFGRNHHLVAILLGNLALLHLEQQQIDRGDAAITQALTIFQTGTPPVYPEYPNLLYIAAKYYGKRGQPQRAEEYYLRAMEFQRQVLPAGHPVLAQAEQRYRETFGNQNNQDQTLARQRR